MKSTKLSISMYPAHLDVIDEYSRVLDIRAKNVRSTTVQKIIEEWTEDRGHAMVMAVSGRPLYRTAHPLGIGYPQLSDLTRVLDITQPIYVVSRVEIATGAVPEQRIDSHFIVVTQPDALNRVHYCRILVVQLVYHNGVAFAPDADEQLAQVEQKRVEIEQWLVGEGYQVRVGIVGLPAGVALVAGIF